jgi:hypothetical protein
MFITFQFCRDWEFRAMKIQAHDAGKRFQNFGSLMFAMTLPGPATASLLSAMTRRHEIEATCREENTTT